jgi:drug/metabolite transporter (DMT)-like permease
LIISSKTKGLILLLIASIVWGSTFVPQKVAMQDWSPLQFTSLRFLIGGIILFFFVNFFSEKIEFLKEFLIFSLISGSVLALAALTQQIGIVTTTATNAGFYTSLYVLIVPIIGIFISKSIHWSIWPSIMVCFIGSILLSSSGDNISLTNISNGDLWIIFSAIFWAIHLHVVSYSVSKFPIFKFSIIQFIICGSLLFIYGSIFESKSFLDFTDISSSGLFYLFYCSLGSVCIGFTLQMFGQRLVEATPAALIMSTEAIFAAFFGWIILSEILNFNGLIGASLIFLGVIFVQLAPTVKI